MNNKKLKIIYYSLLSQKICLGIFSDESIVFILKFGLSYKSFIKLLEFANMENNNKLPSTTIYNFYCK